MKRTLLLTTMAMFVGGLVAVAQPPSPGQPGQPQRLHRMHRARPLRGQRPMLHRRLPPLPLLQVLDANHDGVIDAKEIENAKQALLKLDKNHDGKLTRDEYLPPRRGLKPMPSKRPGMHRGRGHKGGKRHGQRNQ